MGDELRWILLLLGVFFIVGVYFYSRWQLNQEKSNNDIVEENDQLANHSLDKTGAIDVVLPLDMPKKAVDLSQIPNVDKIVVLYVQCTEEKKVSGAKLFEIAARAGFKHNAEDQLFHRLLEADVKQPRIFSMANMHDPGVFDHENIDELLVKGVSIFMPLPGPMNALDAFDSMLASAQRIAKLMDADILDDGFCALTRQRILHLRDEMREFERQRQTI